MGRFVLTAQPCPCGVSSDAYCVDEKGNGWCFSGNCKEPFHKNQQERKEQKIEQAVVKYIPLRGLSEKTIRFYDIKTRFVDNVPFEIGFTYPSGGKKVRSVEGKVFRSEGQMSVPSLFGKDKFDRGSKESITITEGEFDAPSIYEATRGKTAAVSVRSSTMAKRDCIAEHEYINSFDKIIICFDNDDAGQKAAREVSSLFDFNKVYHVKLEKYKDANDYFQNGEVDALERTWQNCKRYSPDNIISTFAEIEASLNQSKEDQIGTYPFQGLQASTYGLHRGEVVVFKGFSGIGKTEVFRAMEHHLLKTTKSNIGIIHLEEDNGTTVKALAGYELNLPATLPDAGLSNKEIFEGYKSAVSGDDSRVHIYSSFELEDESILLDNIRFLVSGAGCDFIFLDHITWCATGLEKEDERLKLDRLTQKLKLLAKELRFCLIMISHTNDEGRTRGSRNIENVANTMIHLHRDKVSLDDQTRRTTFFTIEKVRLGGHTGSAGKAVLDVMSGKLREETTEDTMRMAVQ